MPRFGTKGGPDCAGTHDREHARPQVSVEAGEQSGSVHGV